MKVTPTNNLVTALLTDMYQLTMCYAYWKAGRHNENAVFEVFFRKNPFRGEYCIFAGQDEVLKFMENFSFTNDEIQYLKEVMPSCDNEFFDYLSNVDCSKVKLYGIADGTVVFPREPLLRIEGPLAITQLLETTILNLVNFPSLIATNAARMRRAAGEKKNLLEFGLRRAQGPDGGISASKYAYLGGFDATSNLQAGRLFDIAVRGTHAHAFVMSYCSLNELKCTLLLNKNTNVEEEFLKVVLEKRDLFLPATSPSIIDGAPSPSRQANEGELAAFIAYAQSFPTQFLALIDTYDSLKSGVVNYCAVALALLDFGYKPLGVRIDSGDLAYLSKVIRGAFLHVDEYLRTNDRSALVNLLDWNSEMSLVVPEDAQFGKQAIVASNDINEEVLHSLVHEGHSIDTFGIGTHLVTCKTQPALGCVFKLVEINGQPRIKISQEREKIVIPARKSLYRLYGKDGRPLLDLMQLATEPAPEKDVAIMVYHPFEEAKRACVIPTRVETLISTLWDGEKSLAYTGTTVAEHLEEARSRCKAQLRSLRDDHVRALNPTPFKISLSKKLFDFFHKVWNDEMPVSVLS